MRPFGWKGETSDGEEILFSTEAEIEENEEDDTDDRKRNKNKKK